MPIGPLPQQVTNDLKSLDEMVSEFLPSLTRPPLSIHKTFSCLKDLVSAAFLWSVLCTYEVPHIEKWPVNMTHEPVSNMQGVNS